MAKIFLVRHGQDEDNANGILNGRRDKDLTELGEQQAITVAEKLKDNNISIIYSSPLKRAYKTAKIIAKELGVSEILVDKDLIERDFGLLTGKPVSDIIKYTDKIIFSDGVNYFLEIERSEDFPTVFQRAKRFLQKIQQRYPNENVLIVTHGDVGKFIRSAYHNWSWEKGLKTPYFDNTEVIKLAKRDVLK